MSTITDSGTSEAAPEVGRLVEVRGLVSKSPFPNLKTGAKPQNYVGNIWHGTEGYVVAHDKEVAAFTNNNELITKFGAKGENHFGNFVKAVRSGKRSERAEGRA